MRTPLSQILFVALVAVALAAPIVAEGGTVPRMPNGKPDLSGTYDIATLTPLERPAEFGENLYLTPEQAEEIEANERAQIALGAQKSDPNRDAPDEGGAPPVGLGEEARENLGAGNVGGYNNFWIDRGETVIEVDGRFRTSIITEPANGRRPNMNPEYLKTLAGLRDMFRPNDGTAYWAEWTDREGPYDNPEQRPLAERCLASFGSTVPALPALYNNTKRIIQTEDTVMILNEMVHDVRVVRLDAEHAPPEIKFWFGDSIGWWEGDTLVVDTTNFKGAGGFFGNSETLHVVERFTRWDENTLHYEFTVEDPSRWIGPWKGDFTWPTSDGRVYEYACHEGNYALGNIMRGARLLEKEALEGGDSE